MKATVAICTYNGAARIGLVIEALAVQTQSLETWELLVIDNASTDDTRVVTERAIQEQLADHGRVVREDRPGLSFARARAAQAAQGELLCFLDDDNIPAPTWVAAAIQAFTARPQAGVIGGKVLARWEVLPTPLAEAVAPFALAICDRGDTAQCLQTAGGGIVGAGMCVRTQVLRAIYQSEAAPAQVTGRTGSNLMSGEDLAISTMAQQLGWECWYVPTLLLQHCLPAGRMKKEYLLRLYAGIGRGQAATRKCYDWKARSPLAWLMGGKDFGRWLIGQWRGPSAELRRQHPEIAGDLHALHQSLTLGRARQALAWPR